MSGRIDVSAVRVLGLLSGTSGDGVDAAVAEIRLRDGTLQLTRVGEATLPWPGDLGERVRAALRAESTTAAELCRLDRDLGVGFGQVAAQAVARWGPVTLVASHGQTVHHAVDGAGGGRVGGTLQLGQPAEIAERVGVPVVADFRVRDVAAGGQGAPLVGILDALLLAGAADAGGGADAGGDAGAGPGPGSLAAVNLGGIANLTVRRPGAPIVAFDCGPGNALLDAAVARETGESQDSGGVRTARGTVDPALLAALRADPYLAAPPPKSTGKERYHAGYLDAALAQVPVARLDDLLATLAELTAGVVAAEAGRYRVRRVWASGGGVHNAGLMAALRRRLAEVGASLATTEALGLPVDVKEAYAFAVLGWLTWHGLPGTLPATAGVAGGAGGPGGAATDTAAPGVAAITGAAGPRILGAITPGAGPLRLPPPLPAPPHRARVQ